MAAAGRCPHLLRRRTGQLPYRGEAQGAPPVSVLRGRALPLVLSAVRRRAAAVNLLAVPRQGPAQPDLRPEPHPPACPAARHLPATSVRAHPLTALPADRPH